MAAAGRELRAPDLHVVAYCELSCAERLHALAAVVFDPCQRIHVDGDAQRDEGAAGGIRWIHESSDSNGAGSANFDTPGHQLVAAIPVALYFHFEVQAEVGRLAAFELRSAVGNHGNARYLESRRGTEVRNEALDLQVIARVAADVVALEFELGGDELAHAAEDAAFHLDEISIRDGARRKIHQHGRRKVHHEGIDVEPALSGIE